jgi:hypothetical protein
LFQKGVHVDGSTTAPSVYNTRHKMAQALNLRRQGYVFTAIAETMGISTPYAEKLVKRALREIIKPEAEALLKLELDRLDMMFQPAYAAATYKDPETGNLVFNKEATEVCLKIMERRAKCLGLDSPVKAELNKNLNVNAKDPVQIYLPDNGRGDTPVTIDNETQQVDEDDDIIPDGLHFHEYMATDVDFEEVEDEDD